MGLVLGDEDEEIVGTGVGEMEGEADGNAEGNILGDNDGSCQGIGEGYVVGTEKGWREGDAIGVDVVGLRLGDDEDEEIDEGDLDDGLEVDVNGDWEWVLDGGIEGWIDGTLLEDTIGTRDWL